MITKRTGEQFRGVISDEDADLALLRWALAGGVNKGEYLARQSRGTTIYLHRVVAQRMGIIAAALTGGRSWSGSVDHINGNKLDNRRENLRRRDRKQQMSNLNDRLRSNNTSGYRGVSRINRGDRAKRPWMAYVQVDYHSKSLGMFATFDEAVRARRAWDDAHAD